MMQLDTSSTANNIIHNKNMENENNLFEKLTDLNNLEKAFYNCKKGVGWKASIQKYEALLLHNLLQLKTSLETNTYKQKKFVEFDIVERGKKRHIKSLHISDRVLQRALCDEILTPILSKYLIYDNGASVKNKGIDFARKRLKVHLQKYYRKHGNQGYALLIDYHNFFGSIPHDKLIKAISKHIKDERVLNLISYLISTFDTGDHRGIGLGSQLSQICGIYYLTTVDNYCKCIQRCKYYGRYMDDLYIIHHDKFFLKEMKNDIIRISNELGLSINEKKTQICKLSKGFIFLKMTTHLTESGKIKNKMTKSNIKRERRKLKKLKKKVNKGLIPLEDIIESYKSWRGHFKKFCLQLTIKKLDNLVRELYNYDV